MRRQTRVWSWVSLLVLRLCCAQESLPLCIDHNLHGKCALDDGRNYIGTDILFSNDSTPCLPGEHCRFHTTLELGDMAKSTLRGMVACPVATSGPLKFKQCSVPSCHDLPLCDASLQTNHLPVRNGVVQVYTPRDMVSAMRDPLVANIVMMNDIVLTASDFEGIPVFLKDHRALTIRSNSGLEQLVYDRPFDSGFFEHNWVILGDGCSLYMHNFCSTKAFDFFTRELIFIELQANAWTHLIDSRVSWMCQDGVEFLVGALLVQLDENTPAVRMDDPGGYFFANTSLTVVNNHGSLRFVDTNIICHNSSMLHDDTLEFCTKGVGSPIERLSDEKSPLGSEADMDSVSVVAIAAMMLIMLVWLAFGTLLIVRRYHRPGALAGDMSLFQEATPNEDNPHLPPLQCTNSLEYRPLHGVHTQLEDQRFSQYDSQVAGLQSLARSSFLQELSQGGKAVLTEAIENVKRTLEEYQESKANELLPVSGEETLPVSSDVMDDYDSTKGPVGICEPNVFFTALDGSFSGRVEEGSHSQAFAEAESTNRGIPSKSSLQISDKPLLLPQDIVGLALDMEPSSTRNQANHILPSGRRESVTDSRNCDVESPSILKIDVVPKPEGELTEIEGTELVPMNSVSKTQPVVPMPVVGAVLHGSTGSAYELLSVIGRGSFGVVYAARDVATKRLQAVKVGLNTSTEEKNSLYLNEARMLSMVHCPQVIALRESFVFANRFCIVTEYCAMGSLREMIESVKKEGNIIGLEESIVMPVLVDMCKALASLHSISLIHRDVKAENVLVSNHGSFKLADFGTCRVLHNTSTTFAGTPLYMAPEVIRRHPYSQPSDMWSLGHLLYECCTFEQLFDTNCVESLLEKHDRPYKPLDSSKYSKHLTGVIRMLLTPEPDKRPTAAEVLKMPYVKWVIRQLCASKKRLLRELMRSGTDTNSSVQITDICGVH